MQKRDDPDVPNLHTISRQFGSLKAVPGHLVEWIKSNSEYSDLLPMLEAATMPVVSTTPAKEGTVYLIKAGAHYKIGRSDELERRVKEIRIALPESATLEHSIRTDDPAGIESYWHRRFADRRANGEWFKLTPQDVAAFKRRKYQ